MPSTPDEPPPAPATAPGGGEARADRIRRAIADGTYRLDAERLAEALLAAGAIDPERTR